MPTDTPITIVLADDHDIVRQGLVSLLQSDPAFTVLGQARNGREAVALVEQHTPDVAVLDISMPELNGIEAAERIARLSPDTAIIMLSMHKETDFVIKTLDAGARAYVLKENAYNALVTAIKAVSAGEMYLCPTIRESVKEAMHERNSNHQKNHHLSLTRREREILQLIAEGNTTKDIAEKLTISTKTVEAHRTNIIKKLNAHNVAEATRLAIQQGIIVP